MRDLNSWQRVLRADKVGYSLEAKPYLDFD